MASRSMTWAPARQRTIPPPVREALTLRLTRHACARWKRQCRQVTVHFRGAFAYVDAVPLPRRGRRPNTAGGKGTPAPVPVHLCRLGYVGSANRWEYAFFAYSDLQYKPSVGASGSFFATPEQAFDSSARVYLEE